MKFSPARPPGAGAEEARRVASRRALAAPVAVAVVVVAALLTVTTPAAAYVRYLSESLCPYAWRQRNLVIRAYPRGVADLDEAQIANAVAQAAGVWTETNPTLATCTDLSIGVTMMSLADASPDAKFDRQNNLVFRPDNWCLVPGPDCKDPNALAVTSVFARTWGEIVDADIEVNTKEFIWGDLVSSPMAGGFQDLQNTLTHEVGHLIGLDHSCFDGTSERRPLDQNGIPVADCDDNAPPAVRATTMFSSAPLGDISKRTLEPDDEEAVCALYPRGVEDPAVCAAAPRSESGCAVAAGASLAPSGSLKFRLLTGGVAVFAALAMAMVSWGPRRRSRGRRP